MLLLTWLTTLISTRSPSLATILGPGNCPFTVTMLFVLHSLLTFCFFICVVYVRKTVKIEMERKNKYVVLFNMCKL